MKREWTEEQRQAASERMKARQADNRKKEISTTMRMPIGVRRDITAVKDTPTHSVDRWVNDVPGRVEIFRQAGYENVEQACVGDSGVDGTHSSNGVVSRDMGQGTTAYLMRQRREYFDQDQAEKQRHINEGEEAMRRDKNDTRDDGFTGEIKIG